MLRELQGQGGYPKGITTSQERDSAEAFTVEADQRPKRLAPALAAGFLSGKHVPVKGRATQSTATRLGQ